MALFCQLAPGGARLSGQMILAVRSLSHLARPQAKMLSQSCNRASHALPQWAGQAQRLHFPFYPLRCSGPALWDPAHAVNKQEQQRNNTNIARPQAAPVPPRRLPAPPPQAEQGALQGERLSRRYQNPGVWNHGFICSKSSNYTVSIHTLCVFIFIISLHRETNYEITRSTPLIPIHSCCAITMVCATMV